MTERAASLTQTTKPGSGAGLWTYFTGRLPRWQRFAVGLVGLALLPVMFLPILPLWRIFLVAPQYREGLRMLIFTNNLTGDLDRINILNHYIGMQHIDPGTFPEFGYMPWALTAFGGVAILAALVGRRWLAFLGWSGFAFFGTIMMIHFKGWLTEFGTNLDPKAALHFGAFTPQLLGTAHRGNFTVQSMPHIGGVILFAAGALAPLLVAWDLMRLWRTRSGPPAPGRKAAIGAVGLGLLLPALLAGDVAADPYTSYADPPRPSDLQPLIEAAAPGDTLHLPPGVHPGKLVIDRSLVLESGSACILDGEGRGTVVVVSTPGVVLRGFTVRNSGWELLTDDSGVLIDEADDVTVDGLNLLDTNHGIYIRNALRSRIENCRLEGRKGRVGEENHGNGIHVWYAKDAVIAGNRITRHRDGIYLSFAETASITDNLIFDQDRFGLHSMYSQRNRLERNTLTRNTAGVALMFSNRMLMAGNRFVHNRGQRTYGLLLRDCSDSEFLGNRFENNTIALFLDGSNRNRFRGNLFAENGWGVIAYSSSEANVFTQNNFFDNDYQVSLDMRRTRNVFSENGIGNYWSDARPYDLDGDGVGDVPHYPVGLFAFVSKQHPDLTVFAGSPAVLALDLAQRSLPALQMSELSDPAPLLQPPELAPHRGPAVPDSRAPAAPRRQAPALVAACIFTLGGFAVLRRGR